MYNLNLEILNRIANGNTMAWMVDQQREAQSNVRDIYLCEICSSMIYEDNWNSDNKCCNECCNKEKYERI